MLWVVPGWMPAVHHFPSSSGKRRENIMNLVDQDKDRERSFTDYHHGHN